MAWKARTLVATVALAVASILVPVDTANAATFSTCDQPNLDEPQATADLLCADFGFSERVWVSAEFTVVGPQAEPDVSRPTVFHMLIDPARLRTGLGFS